jgi:hypothetical protein
MLVRGGAIVLIVAALAIVAIALASQQPKSTGVTQPSPSATAIAAAATAMAMPTMAMPTTATSAAPGVTRTYYIAADTVHWDFSPLAMYVITDKPFGDQENTFLKSSDDRIG